MLFRSGFEWISRDDAAHSMLAFVRHGAKGSHPVLVLCNFTPVVRRDWRIGVPLAGRWTERLNTDAAQYGGSGVGAASNLLCSEPVPAHGRPQSIRVTLPPLASVFFEWTD